MSLIYRKRTSFNQGLLNYIQYPSTEILNALLYIYTGIKCQHFKHNIKIC